MRKFIIFIFPLLISSNFWGQENISFSAKTDTNVILLGEQFKLTISASIPEKSSYEWPYWKDTVSGLELVEISKIDSSFSEETWLLTQSFIFTSFDSGSVSTPPLELKVDNQRYSSQSFSISVKYPEVKDEQDYFDIKEPLYVPLNWWRIIKWILIVLLGLSLIGSLIYRFFFHDKRVAIEEKQKLLPPYDQAMQMLKELEAKELWQNGKLKEYYSELTDTLRIFLERQFAINAMESTASEVYEKVWRLKLPRQIDTNLKEMLSLSTLVKYAKENPEQIENEKSFETVKQFFLHHQPKGEKEEKQNGLSVSES